MAIKTISQFDAAAPTDNDYILFEQNGEGKHATIGDVVSACSLSYEEIMASTDLSGKVASASVIKTLDANKLSVIYKYHEWLTTHKFTVARRSVGLIFTDDGTLYSYVIWNLSSMSLVPISGNNTLTATIDNGNVTITMTTGRALIVVGC